MRRLGIATLLALALSGGVSGNANAIYNGHEATPGEHPWMVMLALGTSKFSGCGGSMIAPRWVLTAAHCTFAEDGVNYPPGSLIAVVGRHDREDLTAGRQSPLLRVFVHPDYDPARQSPDVALIELATPLDVPTVQVAHPTKGGLFEPGRMGTVLGWGMTEAGGNSRVLRQTDIPVATAGECETWFAPHPEYPAFDGAGTLCAGFAGNTRTACYQDSGGPWVSRTKYGYRQLGTVSGGLDCGTDYTTYGNLQAPSVREFIAKHVPGALATR